MDVPPPNAQSEADRAARYAKTVAPTLVNVARRAVDLAALDAGQTVLDLGTGTGLAAFLAAERVGRDGTVIGLDASPAMLAVARERSAAVGCDSIKWQLGDATQLTFADESFDAVLAVQSLPVLARPNLALEEVRRVLVEGGRAVATVWGARADNLWIGVLERALRRASPDSALPAPFALGQPGNLEALLQACGFAQVEAVRVSDVLRFQSADAFWAWACAAARWGPLIAALPDAARERMRAAVAVSLAPYTRAGEVTLGRVIVYARAVVPESP